MLKAESEGITPQQLVARIAAGPAAVSAGLSPQLRSLALDRLAREHRAVAGHLPQAEGRRADLREAGRAVLRPGQGHVPAGPLHQGRVPELPLEGPVRRRLRGLQHGLRADRPDQPVLDALGRQAGAEASEHFFFRLSDPKCVDVPAAVARDARAAAAPGRQQGARVARPAAASRRSATGTSRAMRPTSASRSRMRRASTSTCGWMRRSATSPRCKSYFDSGKARAQRRARSFEEFLAAPDTEQIHFIGKDIIYFHTLFWPAMLKFAGPPYKVPDHVYVHGFITVSGEKMSKSRGTGISPLRYLELGMNPEWLRYYIAAKLNANVEDLDFNPDDFVARVNSDLVGKYVNIASRAASFITRHFDGRARVPGRHRAAGARGSPRRTPSRCSEAYESARVRQGACATSWRSPTASIRTSTRTSPGCWPRTRRSAARAAGRVLARAARLQAAVGAAGAGAAAAGRARGAGAVRPRAPLRAGAMPHALPERINPYQHLMTRVDAEAARCAVRGGAARRADQPVPRAASAAAPAGAAAAARRAISIDEFKRSTCASPASSSAETSKAPTSC